MKKFILLFILISAFPVISIAEYTEGKHYHVIQQVAPISNSGKIEVVEMFWYGCPHCFKFEPHVQKWLKTKADDVEFIRVPAVLSKLWKRLARVYYTGEVLGVTEKVHVSIFNDVHKKDARKYKVEDAAPLFEAHGIEKEEFLKKTRSFAVNTKIGQAQSLAIRYAIKGVPAVIVDGRYRINSGRDNSFEQVIKITDFLIEKIRQERLSQTK
jgi:protein dithiol oxidoreductase (disulfide-forming)